MEATMRLRVVTMILLPEAPNFLKFEIVPLFLFSSPLSLLSRLLFCKTCLLDNSHLI
ncbi:hypothetical protein Sjap_009012 [Stephania japonica]|uniref:Uncharacterized protein n=1 Tax=Stephania japonica TaxID=461633 RepID=A0AAP0JQM3_9MAGN